MKRLTIIALIVLLIAGLFVACDQDKIVDDEFNKAIDITSETRSLEVGNTYRTVADTTIADRVTVEGEGSVTIILKEGTTLTAEKGINVTENQELHIEGTGKLVATGEGKSAGIGGGEGEDKDGGTIVIWGGEITANGGSEGGAGIGGGKEGKGGTTIILKQEGKATPVVNTKGGTSESDGIGDGEGATGDKEEIEIDGVGLESSDDELTWYDFDEEPHYRKQYMRTFEGVTISFNANGGTGDMPDQIAHVNKDKKLNANAFTKWEMNFVGWNTKADGTGTTYGNKGTINTDKGVTLFAQWADAIPIDETTTTLEGGNKYTITEDVDNYNRLTITDDGDKTVTIYLPAGTKLTLRKGINVEQGKTLIIEGAGTLDATGDTNCAGIGGDDLTLTRDCGTIIIKGGTVQATGSTYAAGIGGGGGGAGGTVSILGGTVIATGSSTGSTPGIGNGFGASNKGTLTLGTGMSLTGDDTTGDTYITGPVDEDTLYEGERFKIMKTIPSVTVTFDKNDPAVSGEMTPQMIMYNVEQNLNENKYTHPTLNFTGWNTKSDGTGTTIADKGKIKITEDTTLYAQWESAPEVNYITETTTSITSGLTWTIKENVTNTNRIYIDGEDETTILLPAGLKLEAKKGICVLGGQTLIIDGENTGELVIDSVGSGNAGIGGDGDDSVGTITINGGDITVTGGENGAGIGGGYFENGGAINIAGGNITVAGGENGAGIGGGEMGTGGTINITGGNIAATGGSKGAGIGGGDDGDSGTITISGTIATTIITATGGNDGTGIGSGGGSYGGNGEVITINGGKVIAEGGEGAAGIGGGTWSVTPTCGIITINGGIITATGGSHSAGIGCSHSSSLPGGTITINGGSVNAVGGPGDEDLPAKGKGIGGNSHWPGAATIEKGTGITLEKSSDGSSWTASDGSESQRDVYMRASKIETITAATTSLKADTTYTFDADVTNDNRITISGSVTITLPAGKILTLSKGITVAEGQTLTITGDSTGKLYATGSGGNAAIGGESGGTAGTIIINGGDITATGGSSDEGNTLAGAGIGGGDGGSGGTIIISGANTKVTAVGGASYNISEGKSSAGAGIGGGDQAAGGTVNISGGVISATGGSKYSSAGAGIGSGDNGCPSSSVPAVTVTISGGTIVATGGANGGAGIGGGNNSFGGHVTISGGQVETNGGDGSGDTRAMGIGSGKGKSTEGVLSITGLTLYGDNDINPPTSNRGTTTSTRYRYMDVK